MRLRSTLIRFAMLGALAAFAACSSEEEEQQELSITGPEIAAIQSDAPGSLEEDAEPTTARKARPDA